MVLHVVRECVSVVHCFKYWILNSIKTFIVFVNNDVTKRMLHYSQIVESNLIHHRTHIGYIGIILFVSYEELHSFVLSRLQSLLGHQNRYFTSSLHKSISKISHSCQSQFDLFSIADNDSYQIVPHSFSTSQTPHQQICTTLYCFQTNPHLYHCSVLSNISKPILFIRHDATYILEISTFYGIPGMAFISWIH